MPAPNFPPPKNHKGIKRLLVPAIRVVIVRMLELLRDKAGQFAIGKSEDVDLIRIGNLAARNV